MSLEQATLQRAVSVEEAVGMVCEHVDVRRTETVSLIDAVGRTLASPLYTPFPMPPFNRAAMDGYAVRASETRSASELNPVLLKVCGQILPGSAERFKGGSAPFQAVRIFTGAPVPEGYDSVLMQEAVTGALHGAEPSHIKLVRPCRQGEHVASIGEDMETATIALAEGCVIGAKEVALLASFGQHKVSVQARPRAAVLPVGDELVVPGQRRREYQIYDANGLMVEARLRELGAEVIRFDPVPDQPQVIEEAIRAAKVFADILITTGGISVGNHDYVARAAEQAGASPLFRKVLMRPGKPTSAFSYGDGLIISLSGNPSACYAGLELLVKPAVRKAMGVSQYRNTISIAILAEDISKPCPLTRYVRSSVSLSQGQLTVHPLGRDRAGNIAAFANSRALAVIPPGGKGALAGDKVRVMLLDGWLNPETSQQEDLYTCPN